MLEVWQKSIGIRHVHLKVLEIMHAKHNYERSNNLYVCVFNLDSLLPSRMVGLENPTHVTIFFSWNKSFLQAPMVPSILSFSNACTEHRQGIACILGCLLFCLCAFQLYQFLVLTCPPLSEICVEYICTFIMLKACSLALGSLPGQSLGFLLSMPICHSVSSNIFCCWHIWACATHLAFLRVSFA